jgi:hypothetical protein
MDLLDSIGSGPRGGFTGNLLSLIQAIPQAAQGDNGAPPQLDPSIQQMVDPQAQAVAQANYGRNMQANMADLAAGGRKFYQLGGDAGRAAGSQYQSDIERSINDAALLRQTRQQAQSRNAIQQYVNQLKSSSDPIEQRQGQMLGMLDMSDPKLMEQVFRNAFPSKEPRTTQVVTPGDGFSYLVDSASGKQLGRYGAGKPNAAAQQAVDWAANPFKGPMSQAELDVTLPQVMGDPLMRAKLVAGRSAKDTEPYYKQWNLATADYLAQHNISPGSLSSIQASIAGEKKSSQQMQAQSNLLDAFESNERATAENILHLANKIPDSGSPTLNEFLRGAKIAGFGDQDLTDLRTMLNTFIPGAANIITNPRMASGVISDSAREDVKQMVNGNMTTGQLKRAIGRLLVEMDQRKVGLGNQIRQSQGGQQFPGYATPPQQQPMPSVAGVDAAAQPPSSQATFQYVPGKGLVPIGK